MKHLILFLALFTSISFYGQEEIYTEPVEVEGFYKYEKNNSVFYELYEGQVMAPVWFNIKHSVELPDNFENTGLIKVKGTRRRGERVGNTQDFFYREEIVAHKVLWAKDILLEDFLKKQAKERPILNKSYEAEGFLDYTEDYVTFYPKKGNALYPPCKAITEGKIPDAYLEIYKNRGEHLVKIKGYYSEKEDEFYNEVIIKEIISLDTIQVLDDFRYKPQTRRIENIEYFEEEGFYSKGFEHSFFSILRNDSLVGGSGYLSFDRYVQDIDSLKDIPAHKYPELKKGVYMKIKGIKISGNEFGYGRGSNYQVMVSKVEALDRTRTRWDYIAQKVQKKGSCNLRGLELIFYEIYKEGKEYFFTGKDSIYNCQMRLVRNGGYINYNFKCFKASKKISDFSGQLILIEYKVKGAAEGDYDYNPGVHKYESMDDVYKSGLSKFELMVMEDKDELGRFVINVKDGITKDYEERYFVLFEKLD